MKQEMAVPNDPVPFLPRESVSRKRILELQLLRMYGWVFNTDSGVYFVLELRTTESFDPRVSLS
jgi:hypothetical protein